MSKRKKSETPFLSEDHFWNNPQYSPERDGTLEQYFETHDGNSASALFKGFNQFTLLREEGWLAPRMTIIRLMWNFGRDDEHFGVTDEYLLQGLQLPAHSGREGVHHPRIVLEEGPRFEASHVLFPRMRERWKEFLHEILAMKCENEPPNLFFGLE